VPVVNGITDERAYWAAHTGQVDPDDPAKYVLANLGSPTATGSEEWLITSDAAAGKAVLLYRITAGKTVRFISVPLSRPRYPVAVVAYLLGSAGAGTPLDGLIVDQRGLSYALAAHVVGAPKRPPRAHKARLAGVDGRRVQRRRRGARHTLRADRGRAQGAVVRRASRA
jgi:hypothetical protein